MSRAFWVRSWSEDEDVHSPEDLRVVARMAGMKEEEVARCLEAMAGREVKERLKQTTEEAEGRGAFGAPTLFLREEDGQEEMFWGSDRFDMIAGVFNKQWLGPDPDTREAEI